ncbi:MAG: tagaturonate epimerase family protein [Anaerolineae bacterium]|nr:tagaturonate epimerase family protein [Anaerolineae bacterium]
MGADADHAIVVGHDEESLAESLALNRLAIDQSRDYTRFTVDTSNLFGLPATLSAAERARVLGAVRGRRFEVANILPGRPGLCFSYEEEEALDLAHKYWRACAVHKELYDHIAAARGGQPFDYELSLDETAEPTPPRDLLFYLVLLYEVFGLPAGSVTSAGPNLGFAKRHDYEGDLLRGLWPQVNACASILNHFGAMLSVHSADGVRAATGKGPGVDAVLAEASGGQAELKVADVYQEILWQVLAASPDAGEREAFLEAWHETLRAAQELAAVYESGLAGCAPTEARKLFASPLWREAMAGAHGAGALELAQAAIGYGLLLFRLARDLLPQTDPTRPDPDGELFRRFMFLTFRRLRPAVFRSMTREGWERLGAAIEEATLIRLRGMAWGN